MSYSNIIRPQHIFIYKIMEAKCIEMYLTVLLIILPIKKVKYNIYLEWVRLCVSYLHRVVCLHQPGTNLCHKEISKANGYFKN